jgi:hypothetical protein
LRTRVRNRTEQRWQTSFLLSQRSGAHS